MKKRTWKVLALWGLVITIGGMYAAGARQEEKKVRAADHKITNPVITGEVSTWDCVYFGRYFQEDTNGDGLANEKDEKTPVRWRVLSVDGDDVFLLADKNLDCRKFNEEMEITWEKCQHPEERRITVIGRR